MDTLRIARHHGAAPTVRRSLLLLLAAGLLAAAVASSYLLAERMALRSLREDAAHRMNIYKANLVSHLNRFDYLPQMVALSDDVVGMLNDPDDEHKRERASRFLATVSTQAGAAVVYVMDRHGLTLAASNWQGPESFVGGNFAYRPYFNDAVRQREGRFYGMGTVSREPGYYFSAAVIHEGEVIGVTAVKVDLEPLDNAWTHETGHVLVADRNGVIFLSSRPSWKFRTLAHLSSKTVAQLAETRQYWHATPLAPWDWKTRRTLDEASAIGHIGSEVGDAPMLEPMLMQAAAVPGTDWRLMLLTDIGPAQRAARTGALVAGLMLLLAGMLLLHYRQRRRLAGQALSARAALERANDALEHKVQLRTEALSEANRQLQQEVTERQRAEDALRATLADLVHTARMAALGRMSAGITHELNQPLAAMRTLSGNALTFLDRGRLEEAQSNLKMMIQLTEHMGKITSQLRNFARKANCAPDAVHVRQAVADALFLFAQGQGRATILVEQRMEAGDPLALCDASRLQQVLLNLLANAADAVAEVEGPRIVVHLSADAGWVNVEVHDNGPGLSTLARAHLFEPFFSTKGQGMGLGLGLAVSASIVQEAGGTLRAGDSHLLGGALFTLRLRAAPLEVIHYE